MYKEVGIKEVYAPRPTRCEGVGSTGTVPDIYKNIYPTYRVVCFGCGEEFKPLRETGGVPDHDPPRMRFSFPAKFADFCTVGRHKINKGDNVRYLGTDIVCVGHA